MIGHFANKFKLYFWIAVVLLLSSNLILTRSYADQSIEELANSGLIKSQGMASSEGSGEAIPNYSKSEVENEANNLDNLDDAEIRTKSEQKISTADSNSAEGITRDSNQKKIEGFENQEIFTKADKINEDPVAAFERMTNEGCKEKENQQKPHYKKVTKKETVTDTEVYEETCEMPAGNIVCEKTLSVSCSNLSDCGYDAGGIVQGSIDGNIYWRANYPNLYLGTIDKVRDRKRCHLMDKNINFTVKDRSAVKEFRVTNIQYSDWIRISVNGIQAYNSMGGNGPFWKEGSGQWTTVHSGGASRTCNTKEFYSTHPNVDLVPYLRDGSNNIRVELLFGNSGRLYVELRASQYCCREFKDKWEKRCWEQ